MGQLRDVLGAARRAILPRDRDAAAQAGDIMMRGMDGLTLLAAIKKVDPSVPVIMVTAATHSEPSDALRNGAFAYILKPFDVQYIKLLVALAIARHRAAVA